jgi:hypothetical protein
MCVGVGGWRSCAENIVLLLLLKCGTTMRMLAAAYY